MEQTAEWLTIREAMHQLKVGRTTLYRWLKQGRLRAHRVGPRTLRIRREELERVIAPLNDDDEEEAAVHKQETNAVRASLPPIRPLTKEEQAQYFDAIEASREFQARLIAKRGGRPFETESWPLMRASRDEYDERLR